MKKNNCKDNKVTMEVQVVSPEMAKQMLRHCSEVRRVSKRVVDKYAEDMKNGKWEFSPDPIVFDSHGNLMFGYARIAAIAQSGVPIKLGIVRNCPAGLSHVDMPRRRTATENISCANAFLDWVNSYTTATINFIHNVFPEALYKDNNDYAEYIMEFSDEFQKMQNALNGASQGLNRAFVRAALVLALIGDADAELIDEMIHVFKNPEYTSQRRVVNTNFHELREFIVTRMVITDSSFEEKKRLFMTIANVLKATEMHKHVGELDSSWGDMEFPYPVFKIEDNAVVYVYEPLGNGKTEEKDDSAR